VEVLALANSGSGKHRADVEINVLESFEIRSRRSMREAEKAKQAKSAHRARQVMEKAQAKASKKQRELKQPLRVTTPGGKLRTNQGFRTALTMVTASGLLATVALPAYAYDPEIAAMARLTTTNAQDLEQDENTQGLTVAAVNTIKFVRGEYASKAAVDVLRQQAISNYRAYTGPSAADYVQNPPFSTISSELVMQVAASYVGTPYIFGGSNPRGFDCSGYIKFVFSQFGVDLAHGVTAQARAGIIISPSDAVPGDLVIYNDHGHNGIYAGGDLMYHSPQRGDFVKLSKINSISEAGGHYFVRLGTN
jgi:cell wall-associated NlpC family hydrolase